LKLALSLGEYFGLPVEAIFSKQPLQPLSQQVYGTGATRSTNPAQSLANPESVKEKQS
jgi:DNA-binding XRE family transcriptional regulator